MLFLLYLRNAQLKREEDRGNQCKLHPIYFKPAADTTAVAVGVNDLH